jgi:hypothetical protein
MLKTVSHILLSIQPTFSHQRKGSLVKFVDGVGFENKFFES